MRTLEDAVRYPMGDDEWITTVVIGGILTLFSVLLIPAFLLYGYLMRVIRGATAGTTEPPAFGDWGDMLVEGLKAWVIGIVYMIVPLVVVGITAAVGVAAMGTGSEGGAATGIGALFLGLALSGVLALVFGYLAIVGIVNFAREGTIGAAFDVDVIKQVALNREYAIAWLFSVAVLFAAGFIGGLLQVIPVLGTVIAAFVTFYALVVAAALWADGFEDARTGASQKTVVSAENQAV